ncbi:hypothetical protein ACQJBY_053544 [Aegilops geniculata]
MIMMFAASRPFSNNRFEGSQTLPNRETENCRSCRLCEGRGVLLVFVLFLEHLVINLQSSMLSVIERSRLYFCFLP